VSIVRMVQLLVRQFKKAIHAMTLVVALNIIIMKKNTFIAVIFFSFTLLFSCSNNKSNKAIIIKQQDIIQKKIGVNGMTCVGCEVTLEDNVKKIKGVVTVKASHTKNEAIIEFDSTKTNIIKISNEIRKAGYKPFKK